MNRYVIFRCEQDDCWVVSVIKSDSTDVALGVAECPDEKTAKVILQALRIREENKNDG